MRTSHTIFNVVGITFAIIFTISGCGQVSGGGKQSILLWTILVTLLIGCGSLANLFEHRLVMWPTIATIVGYFFSFFLFPFGIWGIVALIRDRRRRRR